MLYEILQDTSGAASGAYMHAHHSIESGIILVSFGTLGSFDSINLYYIVDSLYGQCDQEMQVAKGRQSLQNQRFPLYFKDITNFVAASAYALRLNN